MKAQRSAAVLAIIWFLRAVVCAVSNSTGTDPQVTCPAGTFRGTRLVSLQGYTYIAFIGIPYALPPIGPLRFAKPRAIPRIEHVFNATQFGPVCIQPAGIDLGQPAKEDCLYMNVYLPQKQNEGHHGDSELKKVFFYIHGGGFFMGSSREYMPGDFVAMSDVIVVTFNYRLSWLGFLKGNHFDLPGNQGMWDQLMALRWVQDNIQSFGGDPNDVTLGGNSMGGESVSALSIVPHGKGLFTKGFITSGTMFSCSSTPGSSDILLDLLADRVGCHHENTDNILKCLKELSADKFALPIESHITSKFTTIDGDLFPAPIMDLIKDRVYLKEAGFFSRDYVVSLTNNEGAVEFFGPFDLGVDPDTMSANFLSQHFQIPASVCEKILTWYQLPGHSAFKPSHDAICDYIIALPTYRFLEASASIDGETSDKNEGRTYFLYFDYLPMYLPSVLQGMAHGFDLMYLFDIQPDQMLQYYYDLHTNQTFTKVDFQMKEVYIKMLTEFMKSGDPSGTLKEKFNIQWPAFDLKSEDCLSFSSTPSIRTSPIKDRMHFWNRLFPKYLQEYYQSSHKEEL